MELKHLVLLDRLIHFLSFRCHVYKSHWLLNFFIQNKRNMAKCYWYALVKKDIFILICYHYFSEFLFRVRLRITCIIPLKKIVSLHRTNPFMFSIQITHFAIHNSLDFQLPCIFGLYVSSKQPQDICFLIVKLTVILMHNFRKHKVKITFSSVRQWNVNLWWLLWIHFDCLPPHWLLCFSSLKSPTEYVRANKTIVPIIIHSAGG